MSEDPAITYNTLLAHVQSLGIPVLDFVNHLRPYTVENEIGHGADMTVYKSLLRRHYQPDPIKVALKVPNQDLKENSKNEDGVIDGILVAICQEIQVMKYFMTHPYVIAVYGIAFQDLKPILVVELATASLSDYLISRKAVGNRVGWEIKERFCYKVAEGIKALHSVNIIHGDIKAENILLFGEENELIPKLSDFGYSSAMASITGSKGTPNFWAPECTSMAPLEMKPYVNKSTKDNYSYGLYVWQVAMDGEIPYEDMNIEDIDEAKHSDKQLLELMNQLPKDTPESFKEVIIGMTQYEPTEREDLKNVIGIIISSANNIESSRNDRYSRAYKIAEISMKTLPRDMRSINPKSLRSMPIPLPIKQRLFRTYEAAAIKGDAEAAYFLSICYESGFGVNLDKTKMISWAIQAATGGNLESVRDIATSYSIYIDQLPENLSQLFPWILQAAEDGHKESQLFISSCYKKGICVEKDTVKQKEWEMKYSKNILFGNIMFPEESPLHCAAQEGNIEAIKFFIQQEGMDVNARNSSGITPLYLATFNNHTDIISALIEEFGADVNVKDIKDWTPVHIAAAMGNNAILEILVTKFGAAANVEDNDGIMPLHLAAQNGRVNTLRLLFSKCGVDINVKDNGGWTSVHLAAENGYVNTVKLLVIELGADINVASNIGRTPLSSAAFSGHINIVKMLVVEFGADVNVKENDGWAPLHLAAQNGHIDTVKFLVEFGADVNVKNNTHQTPFYSAARNGHVDVVKFLAEFKADVNSKTNNGWTSLHIAAENGHIDIVKLLVVEFGADANTKNNTGHTPLYLAARNGYIDIVKFLVVELGADINTISDIGRTPLSSASFNGHINVVKLLAIEFRADVNIKEYGGWTSLHLAAQNGHIDIVKFLVIEFKVDADVKANDGRTPLHMAAQYGHVDTVKLLVAELRADINTIDSTGRTPLSLAAFNGHIDIVKLLAVEFGADVNVKENDGWTPLHSAAYNGHVGTVKLLANELEADVNTRDCEGRTPLICSGGERCKAVALVLLDHPHADIYGKTEDGQTLLHLAVKYRQEIVVKILVERFHLDIHAKDSKGRTPLELADDPPVHEYICDGCRKQPVVGELRVCTVCENFGFCSICYSTVDHFDGEHLFKIVELPSVKYLLAP